MPETPSPRVRIGPAVLANDRPLVFVAGLCVLESPELLGRVARELQRVFSEARASWVLKCSFDKANRSSIGSFRGPGLAPALEVFARLKRELGVPVITDIHEPAQAAPAAKVVDALQIPAFLCRQTDLLVAAGRTGKPVNIKKGQFMSPWDMGNAVAKVLSTGNRSVLLTERGASFGYANLVVDMRSIRILARTGCPVIFDATHSCQLPGALGKETGGQPEFVPVLSRAAAAVGVAGVFLETHPDPRRALSDGANALPLRELPRFVRSLLSIDRIAKRLP
jgi:2-dehydro-3-deoxyphosphooctonate aldolase (KDO 8-P synthase)